MKIVDAQKYECSFKNDFNQKLFDGYHAQGNLGYNFARHYSNTKWDDNLHGIVQN